MKLVKDFDEQCMDGKYVVMAKEGVVYDNRTGSESDYYNVFAKRIVRIRKNKDYYVLHV